MVKYWGERVVLNVDEPISERWQSLLIEHGYGVADRVPLIRAGTVGLPTRTSGLTTNL